MARRRVSIAVLLLTVVWIAAAVFTPRPVNPPVHTEQTIGVRSRLPPGVHAALAVSCFDCHSDQTRWPWYSSVFPVSLLLQRHVANARGQMNFSQWETYNPFDRADLLEGVCRKITARDMPLPSYLRLHPDAALSDAQIDMVCRWTRAEVDRLVGAEE